LKTCWHWLSGLVLLGLAANAPIARADDPQTPSSDSTVLQSQPPPSTRIDAPLPPPPPAEDDLPIPTLTLDRIPPNTSFEFAIEASYGQVAYFRDSVPPWIGFGFRAGWGKNFGVNRFGFAGTLTSEGAFGVHTQLGFEPELAWDMVSMKGVLLGLGASPALIWTIDDTTVNVQRSLNLAPTVDARIGWSQTWSRVGRRLFLFLEPKVRFVGDVASPQVMVGVGSGSGR
jgi:hypothetical protein